MEVTSFLPYFIVIYLSAVLLEATYSFWRKAGLYSLKDTLVNFTLGALGIGFRLLTKGAWLFLWIYLFQYAPCKVPSTTWAWILLFLLNEFVYYWFHRWSHQISWLWAVHVNHHSSEELNLSVSARMPLFNILFHNIFWIPLLFLGLKS